jgi:uncharacterized protein
MEEHLDQEERTLLLKLARQALQEVLNGRPLPALDTKLLSRRLLADGAAFVTLTKHGQLRGCIGILEAYQPLVDDVREHALAAALEDYRFPPVSADELADIQIEISWLSSPQLLTYESPTDLIRKLRPGIDGVILKDGRQRATFLPQVWEKLPQPEMFLSQLCMKMGAAPDLWQRKVIHISTYQVEEFHE